MKKYSIGLYPVVDTRAWLEKLLPLGIEHIQLRIKTNIPSNLEYEIQQSILLARKYGAKLYINDHWALAIQLGAYGIHLGQDDLDTADINAIHAAGIKLGLSTHNDEELARALVCEPTYIAFGTIFPTRSKVMTFPPQGLETLAEWRKKVPCPLVAIGGINVNNIGAVLNTGVDGVALISAITQAPDPVVAARELLCLMNQS